MNKIIDEINRIRNSERVKHILEEYGGQIKKIALVCLMIIAGLIVYNVSFSNDSGAEVNDSTISDTGEMSATSIFVDIGGAVRNPMLAELPEGSRVEDAIQAAGGLNEDADISGINRAEFLEDGMKIYIPAFERDEDGNVISETGSSGSLSSAGVSSDGKVNINTADSETLQTLSGVGPVTADKIIEYRETAGRFTSTEDLKNVSGIGDKTFEKLKDYITI